MTNKRIIADDYTLLSIVEEEIKRLGNNADLNHIDTSDVTSMRNVFTKSEFNGDISKWDTSKVKHMDAMFYESEFNGDISQWDVYNVEHMRAMFDRSKFNGDISQWDTSKVESMISMFSESEFNGDISNWDVSKVENMNYMFEDSKFTGNLSEWNVSKVEFMNGMFRNSQFNGDISKWNVRDDCEVGDALTNSPALTNPNPGKLHFMTKAHDESLMLHPDAEAAYAASMPVAKAVYPDESLGVQVGMALETYQASLSASDSYDYTAALDACEESSSTAEAERAR